MYVATRSLRKIPFPLCVRYQNWNAGSRLPLRRQIRCPKHFPICIRSFRGLLKGCHSPGSGRTIRTISFYPWSKKKYKNAENRCILRIKIYRTIGKNTLPFLSTKIFVVPLLDCSNFPGISMLQESWFFFFNTKLCVIRIFRSFSKIRKTESCNIIPVCAYILLYRPKPEW